jgi:glyoxylase I family protein
MHRGLINHLDLTVSDLVRSTRFYDAVLSHLGYGRSFEYEGDVPNWVLRAGEVMVSIGLHPAKVDTPHNRYAPGLHHLALQATSRSEVESLHRVVVALGATVLDAPAEYDYTPGYYAVFFADPDGIKLEVVFEPRLHGAA